MRGRDHQRRRRFIFRNVDRLEMKPFVYPWASIKIEGLKYIWSTSFPILILHGAGYDRH